MPKSKNIRQIKEKFCETPSSKKRVLDASRVIKVILAIEDISNEMKKKVIDDMLWNITGSADGTHGKYLTRFRSVEALNDPEADLIHEHVFKRKDLVDEIFDSGEITEVIMERIIGCVVTNSEHKKLHSVEKKFIGWQRYEVAKIQVIDMLKNEPVKYSR